MAVFLAVRGYNNTRPTPGCLNEYQRKLQIQLTALRASNPWPFTYKLVIGKPEDFDSETFEYVYGNEAPMDPPMGLSDLLDASQWHGPKFSRRHASSLTLGASESRLQMSQPAPTVSIQNQAPQFLQFPQAPQEQHQFAMNLGMMFTQCMQTMFSGGGGGMPMFGGGCGGGGMPSLGGGGCGGGGMPNFGVVGGGDGGGMGPMFGGGGCGFGGDGASALGDFKKKRRVEALRDVGTEDVDPLELARQRMKANKEAAKAGKGSDVPNTGKAAKKAIKALAKQAAKKDENEEDDDEEEDEDEEEEEEEDEDEEEEDEEESEEPVKKKRCQCRSTN
jgi:hypothetical protein